MGGAMDVRIYVQAGCEYSAGAKRLLDEKGITYREIDVTGDPGLRAEMERVSGKRTTPQIFFGEHHVGGYDDLQELDRTQGVRTLLPSEARWAPEP
jgi:glutaredoxin 3